MTDVAPRREAASPYGEWAGTTGVLMSYRYLASRPKAVDRDHAEGWMRLRPDLRSGGGTLNAPLAIAMLDVAGINVDPINILALTQVNVDLVDPAIDVEEVHLVGRVVVEARSQIFTESRILDAADPSRVLGFGTANWSVICPTPPGFTYPEPGTGIDGDGAPPLWQAYTGRRRPDGRLEIPGLGPEIGTERLHHGPLLVVAEAAALEAAARRIGGTPALAVESLSVTILRPGRTGPFVMTPVQVAADGPASGVRIEVSDEGNGGRVIATAVVRLRAGGPTAG